MYAYVASLLKVVYLLMHAHTHTHIHATVTHTFTEVQLYLQKLTLYRLLLLAVNDLSITVKYAGRL